MNRCVFCRWPSIHTGLCHHCDRKQPVYWVRTFLFRLLVWMVWGTIAFATEQTVWELNLKFHHAMGW